MSKTTSAALLFCLFGLLSASAYVAYATWVDNLYGAVPSQYVPPGSSPATVRAAYDNWYRASTALSRYADRKWPILCLGFPIAMTLALLVSKTAGLLPHIDLARSLHGLLPMYFAPAMVLLLTAVSWYILLLPALALAACLLAVSVKIIAPDAPPGFLRRLLFSGAICVALWFLLIPLDSGNHPRSDVAADAFYLAIESLWGGLFGIALAVPPSASSTTP